MFGKVSYEEKNRQKVNMANGHTPNKQYFFVMVKGQPDLANILLN